ncbi:glyceraldehyde-3-phosphate dehydrogenase [Abditibacteriota bacterium]|nr:glyceraldehyde-3-phosphate dehydrogenase [Abditibacteriota bacterium]
MATRIGINGFGRIGRQALKAILNHSSRDLEVVAINDLTDTQTHAHLFKYDSTYGQFAGEVEAQENAIVINGQRIVITAHTSPGAIPWGDLGVDLVIESTGRFTEAVKAAGHLEAGARKVLISAPATGEDVMIVPGVNEAMYNPERHRIISAGSCTTQCVALTAQVLNEAFGIEYGMMNTVHSFTSDQCLQDNVHSDLRRARAATGNIIPTTTGAARALHLVIPELKGRFDGISFRVPTATVSVADLVVTTRNEVSVENINTAFQNAATGPLKGYLNYTKLPLVSSDFRGDTHSSIIDGLSTMVLGQNMAKVVAWYDNEWGFSNRVADLSAFLGRQGF